MFNFSKFKIIILIGLNYGSLLENNDETKCDRMFTSCNNDEYDGKYFNLN